MIPEGAARALEPLRAAYRAAPIGAVIVPGAVTAALAGGLREELRSAGFTPWFVADRGRYAVNDGVEVPELFDSLRALAAHLAGEALEISGSRFLLLRRGDYALRKDDQVPEERSLELTLDLSERPTGAAEVIYTHRGEPFFVVPQAPGSVALVERAPTVRRYDRYLGHRVGEAEVIRLRLALRVVPA